MGAVVSLACAQRRKTCETKVQPGSLQALRSCLVRWGDTENAGHREVHTWLQLLGAGSSPHCTWRVFSADMLECLVWWRSTISVLKKSFGHHVKVQVQEAWDKAVILLMDTALRRKALRVSLETLCPLQPPQTPTASEWVGSCFILFLLDHSEYHGKPFLGLLASWNHCSLRGLLFVDFQLKSKDGRSYLNHLSFPAGVFN